MSSLRLALKQSLENSTGDGKKHSHKSSSHHPLPFGLSDKELRRMQRLEEAQNKKDALRAVAAAAGGGGASDDDDDDDDDVGKRGKKQKKKYKNMIWVF
jgi:hypothetical protein